MHRFDKTYPQLMGFIFIVSYGRSGSTLLQTVIQSIPDAHIRGENDNILAPLWQAYRSARGAKAHWSARGSAEPTHPWYGTNAFRPEVFAGRLVNAFVDEILCPPKTARWIGFKEIRYSEFGDALPRVLDFMAAQFKNAVFVFNTRDAKAVARSGWWKKRDPEEVIAMVRTQDARFAAYAAANPGNCFINSFERLVAEPESLATLFDMLGERFDPALVTSILSNKLRH